MSLSKNQTKLINSLRQKKYRQENGLFIAEGIKVVKELIKSDLEIERLFVTEENCISINEMNKVVLITESELKKVSSFKTPNKVLGIFKVPKMKPIKQSGLILALDSINDPGNLGTIIRLCDWFGIEQLICSTDTVDCYNQKVIQSTMGSITRVNIVYTDLVDFLKKSELPTFTADMNGQNVYKTELPEEAVLIMGNEANGISNEVKSVIQEQLTIPRFGRIQETESLNVATATSILLSEFKRRL
ncbi:TrmH family RNA methyltransferase [Tenacibaculum sp. MEBiC06402]|uniref:TrmH family RNA methyltransferase n=1 Tax=unclassified Tenacibaculum TaxID=2635139 RepID=UPI003B9A57A0